MVGRRTSPTSRSRLKAAFFLLLPLLLWPRLPHRRGAGGIGGSPGMAAPEAPRRRPQIVLFGDSITEQSFRPGGWGAALADAYSRKADIVARGYGGYNTRWAMYLLNHLFPSESSTSPIAVTVFFGANDAALMGRNSKRQHVPLKEYKENLRKIVQHLKIFKPSTGAECCLIGTKRSLFIEGACACSPTMLVVLITPPPIDENGRMEYAQLVYGEKAMKLPERTNEMAGNYAKQCVDLANELQIPYINLWSHMQETSGWQKFLSDGLHLTEEGNAVVYEEVVRVFNEAGLNADYMPYDFPHHSLINGDTPEQAFQLKI